MSYMVNHMIAFVLRIAAERCMQIHLCGKSLGVSHQARILSISAWRDLKLAAEALEATCSNG